MELLDTNKYLDNLSKKYNIEIPDNLRNIKVYDEIRNFSDAEYIYCIAYELLIRTDEYNSILKEYEPLKNKTKNEMTDEEFSNFRKLSDRMNDLGLKKTSFLGFDCEDDKDNVFKRIEYYDEIINSPWNVRILHKFQLDSDDNIFYLLAKFYFEKGKLYKLIDNCYYRLPIEKEELVIDFIKNKSQWKTYKQCREFYNILGYYYIPCIKKSTDEREYKSLGKNIIYLNELDSDFLLTIKEKKSKDLLIKIESNFSHFNIEFWNKYSINDIKNGLNKLIKFHIDNKLIYNKNGKHTYESKDKILANPSNFYIPCINRLSKPQILSCDKKSDFLDNDFFLKNLEFNGFKSKIKEKGHIKLRKEENIYLIQINKYISLALLDDSFLNSLTYEDLKNIYINTEPKFSRPRLMFDEARLTNIPINLNLSKEDLLLYIAQIKDEYDKTKNIVKDYYEYIFNLSLPSEKIELPKNIKHVNEKAKRKRYLTTNKKDLKKEFSNAFFIYDLYKFLLQHQKKLENNIFTEISYLFEPTHQEQNEDTIRFYLTIMKELIHGTNKENESNQLKATYDSNLTNYEPKYKNLIIGKSYIAKSNNKELINSLGI